MLSSARLSNGSHAPSREAQQSISTILYPKVDLLTEIVTMTETRVGVAMLPALIFLNSVLRRST